MADELLFTTDAETLHKQWFSSEYKHIIFMLWYRNGKPRPGKLREISPVDDTSGKKPSIFTMNEWVEQFRVQAKELDDQVQKQLQDYMIKEKVEMLHRHADSGKKIQEMALKYLDAHQDEITVTTAIRMWVEGAKIERSSRGIAPMLEDISDASDEKLASELEKLLMGTAPELLPNPPADGDSDEFGEDDADDL